MLTRLSYYDILGLAHDASEEQIQTSYNGLARSLHPERNRSGVHLINGINEAYATLSNPSKRMKYDRKLQTIQEAVDSEKTVVSKKGRDAIRPFLCMSCKDIVTKSFWESPCCVRLCCEDCLGIGADYPNIRRACPNDSCQEPIRVVVGADGDPTPRGWNWSGQFIQKQIDSIAPTHCCGRNVLPEELKKHRDVCPKLNTECFKCDGRGKLITKHSEMKCDACDGNKVLKGVKWTKCCKCDGSGWTEMGSNCLYKCTTCFSKGHLEGRWTKCFRCEGDGYFNDSMCSSCKDASGSLKGNWARCMSCNGKGSKDCECKGKGAIYGKWTRCFKCKGKGCYGQVGGRVMKCDGCDAKGVIKGFTVRKCSICKGSGCNACERKGREDCDCGHFSCRGHSAINN